MTKVDLNLAALQAQAAQGYIPAPVPTPDHFDNDVVEQVAFRTAKAALVIAYDQLGFLYPNRSRLKPLLDTLEEWNVRFDAWDLGQLGGRNEDFEEQKIFHGQVYASVEDPGEEIRARYSVGGGEWFCTYLPRGLSLNVSEADLRNPEKWLRA